MPAYVRFAPAAARMPDARVMRLKQMAVGRDHAVRLPAFWKKSSAAHYARRCRLPHRSVDTVRTAAGTRTCLAI